MSTPGIPQSNLAKGLRALALSVRRPGASVRALTRGLADIHREQALAHSPIPTAPLRSLVDRGTTASLVDFEPREGNVSLTELLSICSLVRHRRPRVMLEIGTFDGNTALQMALNAADDAVVHTLDLPPNGAAGGEIVAEDRRYIQDQDKQDRRYLHHPAGKRVVQWLGDSRTFDFTRCVERGPVDLAFVDGSHSYDYVRNDTEKVRAVLRPGGAVLWHDYRPVWHGVMQYLDELSRKLRLVRIAGTSLVYWDGG